MTKVPWPNEPEGVTWPGEEPPDYVLDAVALVTAIREDDEAGEHAIKMNSDWYMVMMTLARLLAESTEEADICRAHWRRWALQAAKRGSLRITRYVLSDTYPRAERQLRRGARHQLRLEPALRPSP